MELCNFPFKTLKDMELESGSYVVIEEDLTHYFLEQIKIFRLKYFFPVILLTSS